jgi:ribose transport system permease protein
MKGGSPSKTVGKLILSKLGQTEGRMLLIVVALIVFLSIVSPYFATVDNLKIVAIGIGEDAILVVGMTFLMISGVFDLSIGATLAFAGVCAAKMVLANVPLGLAFSIAVLLGAAIGTGLGFIVALGKVNALIASLGMAYAVNGLTLAVTQGFPVSMMPENYTSLGQGNLMGIPNTVIFMILIICLGGWSLRYFSPLRAVYYLGGNEEAARLAGIPTKTLRVALFSIMGLLASLAGILVSSRLASAGVVFGTGTELRIIAATVIGGVSLKGGKGSIAGALLGLLFLAMINNTLILLSVQIYYQSLITGLMLIAAVLVDQLQDSMSLFSKRSRDRST